MAAKDTFLLVSLEESKAKELAQVISSDACRKILDHLSKAAATETEVAAVLQMPLSTVHYNLKNLVQSNLVETKEYHYSEKGREVLHYSLANRYVIIAPKGTTENFRERLRKFLPVIAVIGAISLVLQYLPRFIGRTSALSSGISASKAAVSEAAIAAAPSAADSGQEMLASAPSAFSATADTTAQTANTLSGTAFSNPSIGVWFAIGAAACMLIMILIDHLRHRKQAANNSNQ